MSLNPALADGSESEAEDGMLGTQEVTLRLHRSSLQMLHLLSQTQTRLLPLFLLTYPQMAPQTLDSRKQPTLS